MSPGDSFLPFCDRKKRFKQLESLSADIDMIFRKILDYVVNDNVRKNDDIY